MTHIRDDLNRRLAELRDASVQDAVWVRDGAAPGSAYFERASRNLNELRSIEATLATMQLADAQLEVADAQREVAQAQRQANEEEASKRSKSEETAFWARRYFTTIAVANAGALFAVVAFMVKPDSPAFPDEDVLGIIRLLMAGTVMGGAYPLVRIAGLRGLMGLGLGRQIVVDWMWPAVMTFLLLGGLAGIIGTVGEAYLDRQNNAVVVAADAR